MYKDKMVFRGLCQLVNKFIIQSPAGQLYTISKDCCMFLCFYINNIYNPCGDKSPITHCRLRNSLITLPQFQQNRANKKIAARK